MKRIALRMYELYRPFRWQLIMSMVLLLATQACLVITPYCFSMALGAVTLHKEMESYEFLAVFFAVSFLKECFANYKDHYEISNITWDIQDYIEGLSFKKLLSLSAGQIENENSGSILQIMAKSERALQGLMSLMLRDALPAIFQAFFYSCAIFTVNIRLGFITLLTAFIFLFLTQYSNRKFGGRMRDLDEHENRKGKFKSELSRNMLLIQLSGRENWAADEHRKKLAEYSTAAKGLWLPFTRFAVKRYWFLDLGRFAFCALGVYLVLPGKLSVGAFLTAYFWAAGAVGAVTQFGSLDRKYLELIAMVRKYFDFLDIAPDVVVPEHPVTLPSLREGIVFENVSFTHKSVTSFFGENGNGKINGEEKKNWPALRNCSLTIVAGKTYAFVGESGAGKTTLGGLVMRKFDPTEGIIWVDSYDLRTIDLRPFRQKIGFVPQDIPLFDDTLRENILFGFSKEEREKITDEVLWDIAVQSGIDRFFDILPKGFDTEVGERGVKLSGGQRQRVATARALARNPDILILDEATSSLDGINEKVIQDSIAKAAQGKTCLIIAHRLSTVRNADVIVVLYKGKIVATGKHEELLVSCPYYKELVATQLG